MLTITNIFLLIFTSTIIYCITKILGFALSFKKLKYLLSKKCPEYVKPDV